MHGGHYKGNIQYSTIILILHCICFYNGEPRLHWYLDSTFDHSICIWIASAVIHAFIHLDQGQSPGGKVVYPGGPGTKITSVSTGNLCADVSNQCRRKSAAHMCGCGSIQRVLGAVVDSDWSQFQVKWNEKQFLWICLSTLTQRYH